MRKSDCRCNGRQCNHELKFFVYFKNKKARSDTDNAPFISYLILLCWGLRVRFASGLPVYLLRQAYHQIYHSHARSSHSTRRNRHQQGAARVSLRRHFRHRDDDPRARTQSARSARPPLHRRTPRRAEASGIDIFQLWPQLDHARHVLVPPQPAIRSLPVHHALDARVAIIATRICRLLSVLRRAVGALPHQ